MVVRASERARNLRKLDIENLRYSEAHSMVQFIDALALDLGSMNALQSLHFDSSDCSDLETMVAFEKALARIVSSAADCPKMTDLQLSSYFYSPIMDQALAECIRSNKALETLSLAVKGSVSVSVPSFKIILPAVQDTIVAGFAILEVSLQREDDETHPWDSDVERSISTYLALNRAGRGYLTTDPADVSKGVNVLSETNDDIDCSYAHLRENPGLVQRRPPIRMNDAKRKASEDGDSDQRKPRKVRQSLVEQN